MPAALDSPTDPFAAVLGCERGGRHIRLTTGMRVRIDAPSRPDLHEAQGEFVSQEPSGVIWVSLDDELGKNSFLEWEVQAL